MNKSFFTLSVCLIISIGFAFSATILKGKQAQEKVPNSELVRLKEFTNVPNYVKFRKGKEFPLEKLNSWLYQFCSTDVQIGLYLLKKEVGKLGLTHYRYQQTVNGIPVELSMYIAHVNNGLVEAVNGEYFSNVSNPGSATLSSSNALNKALDYIGAVSYKWQIQAAEDHLKWEQNDPTATYYPTGELVLMNEDGNVANALKLAYKFNIYAEEPLSRREIYIDANNGNVIWEQNMLHSADVAGIASTLYSGTKNIVCDNSSGPFRLRETGRGNGVRTFTNLNTTTYSNTDITNGSTNWAGPEAGIDAHWGAEMTYDYYWNEHGRNSIDGNGFQLNSYVHHDNNYSNAFWDGTRMTYGDGSGNNAPFTAIDIAGHEVTHGLTSNTANLVYQNESGALNESFSDIFGISIDIINRPGHPNANWILGEDLGFIIRNMANPNSEGDPDTYGGTNWYTGPNDNGGVHTNSGVQNFWFVLLTDGGSGTNDLGDSYTVNSLGMTVAGQIAFRNLTVYLTSSSEYIDARFYAIQSAVDLFGGCTNEVEQVTNAWYAVGVGPAYAPVTVSDFNAPVVSSCVAPFTVNFNNLSVNGITFDWDFGDGNNSTQMSPSNTYTNYGTYTVELIVDGGPTCGADTTTKLAYIVVDSLAPCVTVLPTSGTYTTQTSCIGTIYDSGGATANYGANEDAQITISPAGAGSIDLAFVSFDVEAGSSVPLCDYDYVEVYDGPSTASPLIDRYCNNNVPTVVSSSSGSITVVFHSDPGVEDAGFQIDWQCQYPTQAPNVDFTANIDTTCTGEVEFMDLSTNGPQSWLWDFGDGDTSSTQNPSHTYLANGLYTVELTASNIIGSGNMVKTSYIYVDRPIAPTTIGDSICVNNTANLSASGSGILNWYAAATGGSILNTGLTYTTPVLATTTNYYVEDVIVSPNQSMGKPNTTGSGANFTGQQYIMFDVYNPIEIIDVKTYPGSNGVRFIELRNQSGTVLQSKVVAINGVGPQTVVLNFTVMPGTDYQLGLSPTSPTADLYRNDGGVNYPYAISGLASITHSSANQNNGLDHYYFFYDWNVKEPDCVSSRTPVTAIVNSCTGVDELNNSSQVSSFIDAANNLNLTMVNLNKGNYNMAVTNTLGQVVITSTFMVASNNQKELVNLNNLAKGIYYVNVYNDKAKYIVKVVR